MIKRIVLLNTNHNDAIIEVGKKWSGYHEAVEYKEVKKIFFMSYGTYGPDHFVVQVVEGEDYRIVTSAVELFQ